MKKFTINFLKIVIKTACAFALFATTWQFLSPYFRAEHNADGDMFRNLPEQSVDVIALGSSHMQYAFDPGVFYAETGNYAYVLGSSCQPLETSYYMLKEALKTQTPELVLLDVFTLLPQSEVCYADGMYYKAIDMMSGTNRIEAGLNVPVKEVRNTYAFDLIMNHSNWTTMDLNDMESIKKNAEVTTDLNWILGYVRQEPYDFRKGELDHFEVTERVSLTDTEKEYLRKIQDLCNENNIRILFVKTPYVIDQDSTNKLDAVWNYLDSIGAQHIDFVAMAEEIGWYNLMDGDAWHNNSWGAEVITRWISNYTKQENLIQKHQDNEVMDELCNAAKWMSSRSLLMEKNIDIYRMLYYADKYDGAVFIRYKGRSYTTITEKEQELLSNLGLTKDFVHDFYTDYYAYVENGQMVQESDKPFSVHYNESEFTMTDNEILIDGATYFGHLGDLEFYFTDPKVSVLNAIGINYTKKFWKVGCDDWACY